MRVPALTIALLCARFAAAECSTCESPSWIFQQSTFTHDPHTGARVAQYVRTPPVEPLDDPRLVTSSYRRTRSTLRGADGSVDTSYQVQSWGNGRGGIDAEWERFHDAWRQSFLSGSYNSGSAYGSGYYGGAPGGYPQPYPYGGSPSYGYGPAPGYGYGPPPSYGYGPRGYGGPPRGDGRRD